MITYTTHFSLTLVEVVLYAALILIAVWNLIQAAYHHGKAKGIAYGHDLCLKMYVEALKKLTEVGQSPESDEDNSEGDEA